MERGSKTAERIRRQATEERLSYDDLSTHFLDLYLTIARKGDSQLPVFSGDLSVALRERHRVIKDIIESHFLELRRTYGRSIQVVRYKRRMGCRAMRGYLMPFQAMVRLLYVVGLDTPLLRTPELLFVGYRGDSHYVTLFN